ncbi:MAG: ABC transporter ATP-binding protein [Solirubrobacteraceae bacterium]|nr:ABC transporter ATP-binding protein [Solirubrobacteraceae bacterium]
MLEVVGLSKEYHGANGSTTAIAELSFSVNELEFVSVVGPSGCGKTTLLKCISGLLEPSSGGSLLRGVKIVSPPEAMALVFQDYARSLLPWLTVSGNVGLPLRRKHAAAERQRLADEALKAVGLSAFLDHYPWQLSGGMQQRVAIARALACQPRVLLLDEPFASVDAQTRAELEDLVLSLRSRFDITVLLVTHDIDEAVYMSDRIVVLTKQPSTIRDTLDVGLPWPRDQLTTKAMPMFSSLRAHVYREIVEAHRPRHLDAAVADEQMVVRPGVS